MVTIRNVYSFKNLIDNTKVEAFQTAMIEFYKKFGRDFPWRHTSDPWIVLLSELLLRKTSAKQVEKIFPELSQYTPCELSKLDLDVLSRILTPLGIHKQRARLIRRVAYLVCKRGGVPPNEKMLIELPGVGRYTANAVLCISYSIPRAMMDRNMIRVIERFFGIKSSKKRPHTDRALWEFANSLVPKENCKEFNWGVLDFAAQVCTARSPKCSSCPLRNFCESYTSLQGRNSQ